MHDRGRVIPARERQKTVLARSVGWCSMADGPVIIKRIKKGGHGGHHGGAWKVAYADFVTAMMAFFMVMWILGMDENVKNSIEGYFSNPVGYKKGYNAGASPISSGASPAVVKT